MKRMVLLLLLCISPFCFADDTSTAKRPKLSSWLNSVYGGQAKWLGHWDNLQQNDGVEIDAEVLALDRNICADSGPRPDNIRYVAVCGTVSDAGHVTSGLTDLWILDTRTKQPRVIASSRDIQNGSFGSPGDVRLIEIGPQALAFVIEGGMSNMGTTVEKTVLYMQSSEEILENALEFTSHYDNSGFCDAETDAECKKRSVSMTCALKIDKTQFSGPDHYQLSIRSEGQRSGREHLPVTIVLPFNSGRYLLDGKSQQRLGCDYEL
jgi:hypothetical protein